MSQENIIKIITDELGVAPRQVQATITLLDDANTIPFIARYRKEVTGSLDEEQLRVIAQRLACHPVLTVAAVQITTEHAE